MKTSLLLTNCRLAFSDFMVPGGVLLENGKIARLWLDEQPSGITSVRNLDCGGLIVAPGLVDIHNHGGLTHDFVAADASGNNIALDFHAQHGVTAMLATVMTETHEQMSNALRLLAEQKKAGEICPNFLGIHVEGPYFHPDKRGAHKLECLRDPMRSEYERFWEVSDGLIRIFTHAPERTGSMEFCQYFHERGCVPAIGHTRATLAEIRGVSAYGARHFVHANNAIDWPQRRMCSEGWLGTEMMGMGALLSHSTFTGEIISDGYHVPLEMIRVILAARGSDAVAIVSDSCSATGCPLGEYVLGGLKIILRENALVLSGTGSMEGAIPLGGSATTLLQMIRNYIKWGFGLLMPLKMATSVPARIIEQRNKGSLCVGSDGDLIVIDDDAKWFGTIIGGQVTHAADPSWKE